MRTTSSRAERPASMDIGILVGMALFLLVFETVPGIGFGRLATATSQQEMTGYDPGELYEIPPELPEDPVDVNELIEENLVVEIDPVQIISTSDDTTGLAVVGTVDNPDMVDPIGNTDQGIPEPGTFIPHSQPPLCTLRPSPEYPEMASMAGVEGRVILQVFVSVDGVPADVVLMQSSGLDSMDESALAAAWETRWNPAARADGQPVGVWTSLIYDFVLE